MKASCIFALVILGATLAGCGAILPREERWQEAEEELQEQLVGMDIADVLEENPLPEKVIPDGKGGQIYVWNIIRKQFVGLKRPRLRTDLDTIMVYVDAEGRVYQARIVGE